MNDSFLFISDIHLGLQSQEAEKKKERLLVEFLKFAGYHAKELYIVGDLFDYWFEYKTVYQKGFFRTLTAMQDLTEAGIEIHYIIGNHDFMHRSFFSEEIGCKMYEEPVERVLGGKKFYIGHGDGLIKNDRGYNALKKIMRNKKLQRMYSWIHPDLGISLASKSSKTSREYTTKKDFGNIDGLFDVAAEKIDEGFEYVIFGHRHKRIFEKYKNGYYVNLGSWLKDPCYGIFTGNEFKIIDITAGSLSLPEK
ncbi:MAG: UDP-2,3-diacylglucosamine diphosphatase [Ignavibacteriaceae bacterium]